MKTLCYLLLCATLSFQCLKKDFDEPPDKSQYDPELPVNGTFEDLRALPAGQVISEDLILAGFVIANDQSGNYYKALILQDSTAGLELSLDQSFLYADYPLGRKLYIRCKGLLLENKDGFLRLGYRPEDGQGFRALPEGSIDQHLVKASYPHALSADTVDIRELHNAERARLLNNRLITISDVEFIDAHSQVPFARPSAEAYSTARQLQNCDRIGLDLHTSAYAQFQAQLTPEGKGTITGVFNFGDQHPGLRIRDTADVHFYGVRCSGGPPADQAYITIDSLRKMHTGFPLTLPPIRIRGIVISDRENGNIAERNVVLQGGDQDKGILLYYSGSADYKRGDSLEVDIGGCELKRFNGKLEVANVSVTQTRVLGSEKRIAPKDVQIATVLSDPSAYESTLIRFSGVSWSNAHPTWFGASGVLEITDGTDTMAHYCAFQAKFKDQSLPFPPVSSVTGYLDLHNNMPQLRIRQPGPPLHDVVP